MISKKDLIEVTFSVLNKCNLKCPWCFEDSSSRSNIILSIKDIVFVFKKLKGLQAINLTGGEIFVHRDINKILQYAVRYFPQVHLITNGTKIPKSMIPFFKKHHISFGISIDGPKNVHDQIRGQGSFNKTIKNIKLLRKNGLYVNMQATVSKLNIAYVDEIISQGKKLGVDRISFIRLKAIGRGSKYFNIVLNSKEVKDLNYKIFEINQHKNNIHIMLKDSFYNTLNQKLINRNTKLGSNYVCGGCRAGMEILHIEPNGDIYPCPYLQIKLGNVFSDDIYRIWKNHPVLNSIRSKEKYVKCVRCNYWGICRGCRAESFRTTGNYLGPDPQCWRRNDQK